MSEMPIQPLQNLQFDHFQTALIEEQTTTLRHFVEHHLLALKRTHSIHHRLKLRYRRCTNMNVTTLQDGRKLFEVFYQNIY